MTELSQFTSCDISDALLKRKITNGGFIPDLILRTKASYPIIGRAWTVQFVEKTDPRTPTFGGHYIDEIQQFDLPTIPIIAAPSSLTNAVFGGIMGMRAAKQGCRAVIVAGRVRDVEELEASGLSILSRGTSSVGAGGSSKPISVGGDCHVEGYGTLASGDIIFIDANGVVVIPKSINITDLCTEMKDLVAKDEQVKNAVAGGMSVNEAFAKYR